MVAQTIKTYLIKTLTYRLSVQYIPTRWCCDVSVVSAVYPDTFVLWRIGCQYCTSRYVGAVTYQLSVLYIPIRLCCDVSVFNTVLPDTLVLWSIGWQYSTSRYVGEVILNGSSYMRHSFWFFCFYEMHASLICFLSFIYIFKTKYLQTRRNCASKVAVIHYR